MSVLERIPAHDPLEELVTRVRPLVAGVLQRFRIPFQDGDDLVQQTWLLYLQKRPTTERPETWVVATLQHLCLKYWRARRRRLYDAVDKSLLELMEKPASSPQESENLKHDLRHLLSRVSARCRSLLLLRYHLGCDPPEVADRLGYKPSSIGALTSRCLAAVTRQVAGLGLAQEGPNG